MLNKKILVGLLGSVIALGAYSAAHAATSTTEWDTANVTITNNVGTPDTVEVKGLTEGAVVKVYDKPTKGTLLGSAIVGKGKTEAIVKIKELGPAGKIYVSVMLESATEELSFDDEQTSTALDADKITISNNSGMKDTITVKQLNVGTIIKVYDQETGGKLLGSGNVTKGKNEVIINVTQLGVENGTVYVTITEPNMRESSRVSKDYDKEAETKEPLADDITIVNRVGAPDTVTVALSAEGTLAKVYDQALNGRLLGQASAKKGTREAVISIKQLGSEDGSVFVSLTEPNKRESNTTEQTFIKEEVTNVPDAGNVTIVNKAGSADLVTVEEVKAGVTIKVYNKATNGVLLGSAITKNGEALIKIAQLGTEDGSVYITATEPFKKESDTVEVNFIAEEQTKPVDAADSVVTNNANAADTVTVSNLDEGTTIKLYSKDTKGKLLGSGIVKKGGSEVTISISQLGAASGTIYASATAPDKRESDVVALDYEEEVQTEQPTNITIENSKGLSDLITVGGLQPGDVVKVYVSGKKTLLGSGVVAQGRTKLDIIIKQLGVDGGSVEITVIGKNKLESERVSSTYSAEK